MAQEAVNQIEVQLPLDVRVEEMSVADEQLIAIAKAMRQNAQLIIMDEPTSALTEREIRTLFTVIHKLQQRGVAFLFVSHKLNEVLEISESIIVMRNGQVVSTGPAGEYNTTRLVFEMTGQSIAEKFYDYTPDFSQPTLLRVEPLTWRACCVMYPSRCAPMKLSASPGYLDRGAPNWRWRSLGCCLSPPGRLKSTKSR